jgi:hypothetical protein
VEDREGKGMRETFHSLNDLAGYYRFIKSQLTGSATLLPKKDFDHSNHRDPMRAQSHREDLLAFVCDVERYVKWFEKKQNGYVNITQEFLLPIFLLRFCPEACRYHGYRHMANCIRTRIEHGESIPKRLQFHYKLKEIADSMYDLAEDYFIEKNMIEGKKMRFIHGSPNR